jgi:hypothetical protein
MKKFCMLQDVLQLPSISRQGAAYDARKSFLEMPGDDKRHSVRCCRRNALPARDAWVMRDVAYDMIDLNAKRVQYVALACAWRLPPGL